MDSAAGIVFRRLDAADEQRRATSLLTACGSRADDPATVWYGLCDLTVAEVDGLAGVVTVCPIGPRTVRLGALAVPVAYRGRGLGRRLLGEMADRLRASGVEQIVAPAVSDRHLAAVLDRAGFVARPQGRGDRWLLL
ncbi:MAG TPA: GNAT family N-acetyltransferase [Actinoplanes sp.]